MPSNSKELVSDSVRVLPSIPVELWVKREQKA